MCKIAEEFISTRHFSDAFSALYEGDGKPMIELMSQFEANIRAEYEWNYNMDEAPKALSSTNEFLLLLHDPSKPHTIYKRHAKIFGCPEFNGKGVFQAVWGGAWERNDEKLPEWWFVDDERFETALSPIAWKRITTPEVGDE